MASKPPSRGTVAYLASIIERDQRARVIRESRTAHKGRLTGRPRNRGSKETVKSQEKISTTITDKELDERTRVQVEHKMGMAIILVGGKTYVYVHRDGSISRVPSRYGTLATVGDWDWGGPEPKRRI